MKRASLLFIPLGLLFSQWLAACAPGTDDCESVQAQLRETRSQLASTKQLLDETRKKLEFTKDALRDARAERTRTTGALERVQGLPSRKKTVRLSEGEKRSADGSSLCEKEKMALRAELASALHEALFLKHKVEELTKGLEDLSGRLEITKEANIALRNEVHRLSQENARLRDRISKGQGP